MLAFNITHMRRKLSKVNGQLEPELRQPGCKPQKLPSSQADYRAAWLGEDNQYTEAYKPLKELCAKAEEQQYKWLTTIPTSDLPEAWVRCFCIARSYAWPCKF